MLKATLISLLAFSAVPSALAVGRTATQATTKVTVGQLSTIIASSHKQRDRKLAQRLYGLQLTQRLSARKFSVLNEELPGHKSRQALDLLADESVFLPPPPSQVPNRPPPPIQRQQVIVNRTIAYVVATLHQLPNLFARIHIIRYRNAQPVSLLNARTGGFLHYGKIQKVNHSVATVLYQNGREVIQKNGKHRDRITPSVSFMTSYGEFGPIFTVIFGDLPKGKLAWSHWVQGPHGVDAVFHFAVPKAASHDVVGYCCVNGQPSKKIRAYHGELTIDPSTGTVLRLTIVTDTTPDNPLTTWGMMVQYGPVTLGGNTYFCPIQSVSLYRAPVGMTVPEVYRHLGFVRSKASSPGVRMETQLNQTTYSQYHLFRAEVRIHPEYETKHPVQPPGKPARPQAASGPQHQLQQLP